MLYLRNGLLFCFFVVVATFAGDTSIFERVFERNNGKPAAEIFTFEVQNAQNAQVTIINGPATFKRVSSAEIFINNNQIATENEFNQGIASLEKTVNLQNINKIQVLLRSEPGSAIKITIRGLNAIGPEVRILYPEHNSIITTNSPLINVAYVSTQFPLNLSTFKILLDNVDKTSELTANTTYATGTFHDTLSQGNHILKTIILDNNANIGEHTVSFYVDSKPPEISIVNVVNKVSSIDTPAINIEWHDYGSGPDSRTFKFLVNNSDITSKCVLTDNSAVCRITEPLQEITNQFTAIIADSAGNYDTAIAYYTVDKTAPVVTIQSPVNGLLTNSPTINVAWTIDGVTQTTQTTETLTEGANIITRSATDAAGNTGTASVNVTLDTQVPVVVISSPANNSVTTQNTINVVWTVDGITQSTQTTAMLTNGVNTITRSFTDDAGNTGVATVQITLKTNTLPLPPDPVTVAPKLDSTQFTSMKDATSFLYTGTHPIQKGVAEGTIELNRVAVIRGKVLDRNNNPLSGVKITISGHPEFGQTLSRQDGMFDIAVNGGGFLKIVYEKETWFDVHRQIDVPWQNYVIAPDVVMVQADPVVTPISLTANTEMQVMRASTVTDNDGTRTATILFPPGIEVTSGNYSTINVRATEYTAGENGKNAMPAELPPATGYTYCTELSVDGVENVTFNKPVYFYLENFLNFPVGGIVPAGYYSRNGYSSGSSCNESTEPAWIPSENGRIVKVLSIENNTTILDVKGDGVPATQDVLDSLGITEEEQRKIAGLYQPGQSLWRVPITHFTPWDCNWPYGPPDSAEEPEVELDTFYIEEEPCNKSGSIIDVQNQILQEQLPITGTSFSLNYSSKRGIGRTSENTVKIPLTKETYPSCLKRIELTIEIAGRVFNQTFQPSTNLVTSFTWDGYDAYNRKVNDPTKAVISIGYVYNAIYQEPGNFEKSFGSLSGAKMVDDRSRSEITMWKKSERTLENIDERPYGLGGFSISSQHRLDPNTGMLYNGNGTIQNFSSYVPIIKTVAGDGNYSCDANDDCGEGGPADKAFVSRISDVTVAADGTVYFIDRDAQRLKKIVADGTIHTVAGTYGDFSDYGIYGDTLNCAPAIDAKFFIPTSVAVGPDGSIYVLCDYYPRIFKIKDGIISVFAGTGEAGFSGDGGPATLAQFYANDGKIAVGPDGKVYLADAGNNRIRCIDLDGTIRTIAGNGVEYGGYSGENVDAKNASLWYPRGLAVDKYGCIYIGEYYRIRKIGTDGIIRTIAGQDIWKSDRGDGADAHNAWFLAADDIDIDQNGAIVFADRYDTRVRLIDNSGIISTLAGGIRMYPMYNGDNIPARSACLNYPTSVAFDNEGNVYVADANNLRLRKIESPHKKGLGYSNIDFPSGDGSLRFVFDRNGKHLRTENALTNTALVQFIYNEHGTLDSIVDASGNATIIERNSDGTPAAIVGPYGQRSLLTLNTDGYLSSITNPAGEKIQMNYQNNGLLSSFTDSKGNSSTFEYDTLGRLIKDTDAKGGFTSLQRVELDDGYEVRDSTAEGVVKVYKTRRLPDGTKVKEVQGCCGNSTISYTYPDGRIETTSSDNTKVSITQGPDPRFGMIVPIASKIITTLPSGQSTEASTESRVTYTADGELDSLITVSNFGNRFYRKIYANSEKKFISISPEGRVSEDKIDSLGRLIYSKNGGLDSITYLYDSRGRITSIEQGDGISLRKLTYEYDIHGNVKYVTDPLGNKSSFNYDNADRVTNEQLPDLTNIRYEYDLNGNVTRVITPGNNYHDYNYDIIDNPASYKPPMVSEGNTLSSIEYNLNRDISKITQPNGFMVNFHYDSFGRISSVSTPDGNLSYSYDPVTNKEISCITPESNTLYWNYDGDLLTAEHSEGIVNDSVIYSYNSDLRIGTCSAAGTTDEFQYDMDGLVTRVQDLTIARDPLNGNITGSSIGGINDNFGYNSTGEVIQYNADYQGAELLGLSYERDKTGRIIAKTESIDGQTHQYQYFYNLSGYLERVSKDGTTITSYTFDPDGNRTSINGVSGNRNYVYDAQDRMLSDGISSYAYNSNGELISRSENDSVTKYEYDSFGNLKKVILKNGKIIEYVTDGKNRRIAKIVNGVVSRKWTYQGLLRPIAEYDGQDNLIARYVYANNINVPEYMIKNGETYRLITDLLGSVRIIVNVATGEIVQRMDYDEYGNILSDSNSGFTPFGFAGGMYDIDTKLTRFFYRDYDANSGRWTTKDPNGQGAGFNVYLYVNNSPVSYIDPTGEFAQIIVGAVVGAATETLIQLALMIVDPCHEFDWSDVGGGALLGAATGGLGSIVKALKALKTANKLKKVTGGFCFVEGTLVTTDAGTKKIEDIKEGEFVLSRNDKTGEETFKPVLQTIVTKNQNVLKLSLTRNDTITEEFRVTGIHPFYVKNSGWRYAENLKIGDTVTCSDSNWLIVNYSVALDSNYTVYNFEVADFHTYFVGTSRVWVHNNPCSQGFKVSETFKNPMDALGLTNTKVIRIKIEKTKNFEWSDKGFTEKHYYLDSSNGVQKSLFYNPKTKAYTGGHNSSGQ